MSTNDDAKPAAKKPRVAEEDQSRPGQVDPAPFAELLAKQDERHAEGLAKLETKLEAKLESEQAKLKAEQAKLKAEQVKLKAEQAKLKAEQDEGFAKLKVDQTHKGVTSNAQFLDSLRQGGELLTLEKIQGLGLPEPSPNWPLQEYPEVVRLSSNESKVQEVFEEVIESLHGNAEFLTTAKSLPAKRAYNSVSFGSRKPDLVNHEKSSTGSLSITSFGDCKRPGRGDFNREEMGHILDMARLFLEKVAFHRTFVFVFLTDAERWQFFKVMRDGNKLKYYQAPLEIREEGWRYYLALLQAELTDIGHWKPAIKGVELKTGLGRGKSAMVYEGLYKEARVLVKVFKKSETAAYTAEKNALQVLAGIDGVPTLVADVSVENGPKGDVAPQAILATPIGKVLRPSGRFGECVNGEHLQQLVNIVQSAHLCDLVHRDIKPGNTYLTEEGRFLLNDWSSSTCATQRPPTWEGTYGFSVTMSEREESWTDTVCDLISVVRTAYVLITKEWPPASETDAPAFWAERFREGTVWSDAVGFATGVNYHGLGELLCKLK